MRAAVLQEFGAPMHVEEVQPVALREHDVRLRVEASGICHSDHTIAHGGMAVPLPILLGHEAAGTVTEVGAAVTRVAPGQRAIVTGPHCGACPNCIRGLVRQCRLDAELRLAPKARRADGTDLVGLGGMGLWADEVPLHEAQLLPVETDLPSEQLALVGCAVATGAGAAMFTAAVAPGSSVAVIGAGGVGLATVQGARICGAARIIVIDPVSTKRDQALRLGATDAVDPAAGEPVEQVRVLTSGAGVDYAFEVVGHPDLILQAYAMARRNGTVVVVGMSRATDTVTLPALPLMMEGKRILGSFMGGSDIHRDYPKLIRLAEAGALDIGAMVTRRITLDQVNDALDALARGEGVRSVIV